MRTYEEIERDINDIIVKKKEYDEILQRLDEQMKQYYEEMDQYKLQNKLYHPMNHLDEYKNCTIDYIKMIYKNKDDSLGTIEFYNLGVLWIDDDRKIICLNGIAHESLTFSKKRNQYIHKKNGNETLYDFVGFLDIAL